MRLQTSLMQALTFHTIHGILKRSTLGGLTMDYWLGLLIPAVIIFVVPTVIEVLIRRYRQKKQDSL